MNVKLYTTLGGFISASPDLSSKKYENRHELMVNQL